MASKAGQGEKGKDEICHWREDASIGKVGFGLPGGKEGPRYNARPGKNKMESCERFGIRFD